MNSSGNNLSSQRNIVLIGFMGCGKSTIGKILHKKVGYPQIDTDDLIVKQEQKKIKEIFADSGEECFRDLETALLKELLSDGVDTTIISTGGGMPVRKENRYLLKELGFVIWLSCPANEVMARTSKNGERPLLNGPDPLGTITRLIEERTPIYKDAAHLEINTHGLSFDEIACGIIESAQYHFAQIHE